MSMAVSFVAGAATGSWTIIAQPRVDERSRLARRRLAPLESRDKADDGILSPPPGIGRAAARFKITLGLRAGYSPAGRIYDLEEAVRTAHRWMTERAARGEAFLSGMFTRGEV